MEEIWAPIKGYEKSYWVSTSGKVVSCGEFYRWDGKLYLKRSYDHKVLKPRLHSRGYHRVSLPNKVDKYIHRLVYETFVESIPKDKVINHIDGNKTNNWLDNLECISHHENINHYWDEIYY